MRMAWSLVVAWCMVAAATPHGARDLARQTTMVKAPAFHHPMRQRELRSDLAPFVAVARTELLVPAPATSLISEPGEVQGAERVLRAARARGPPQA